jgi:galactokinase
MNSEPRWHPESSAASPSAAARLFHAAFGETPAGVWSAPGRVNLIGEHVDYAGGVCLPFALGHRTWVAVRLRTDGRLRLVSDRLDEPWSGPVDGIGPGRPAGWAAYPAGVAWALVGEGLVAAGFGGADVAVASDVPLGAGLSSSAALECAVAVALVDLAGPGSGAPGSPVRSRMAAACVRAENEVARAMTGGMDQAIALHARRGYGLRLDCDSGAIDPVPLDLAGHGLALLVVNTNAPHRLVDGQYADRRASVERAARVLGIRALGELRPNGRAGSSGGGGSADEAVASLRREDPVLARRARHVITETARAIQAVDLLDRELVAGLGPLLTASHESLRDDFEISCVELDSAVDAALAAGARGARLVGGGFGGSAIALVDASAVPEVAAAVRAEAARRGLAEPDFLPAEPGYAAVAYRP